MNKCCSPTSVLLLNCACGVFAPFVPRPKLVTDEHLIEAVQQILDTSLRFGEVSIVGM